MKKLLLFLLFPLYGWAQTTDANLKAVQIDPKIRNITTASGITKGNVSDVLQAMVNSKISRIEANSTSGANTYTATISWLTGYSFGLNFPVVFNTGNTGASTLNVNTLGAISLKKNGGTALSSGDIQNGQVFWVFYDGSNFQMIGGGGSTITPAALTKVDDTNVTLTLGGSPSTALVNAASLTLGWTGTLADGRIASASTWNAKQSAITFGTGVQTALGVNIGSAGAPVLINGAAGTPSSINLSNASATSLPHSAIANTAVTPGSYTNTNLTVAADGSITAASNGSGGGTTTNALTVDNSSLQLNSGTTFDGSAAKTISVKASGITNSMLAGSIDLTSKVTGLLPPANGGTGANLSATGGVNNIVKQTSVGGAFTVAPLTRQDISVATQKIGSVFTEPWNNTTNWTGVGTPGASVTSNQLSFSGTASLSTNYIYNNSYGNTNFESYSISWTETVGTMGASTNGIGFALVSNASLGSSYQNGIMVNVRLVTGGTAGIIDWYSTNGSGGGAFGAVAQSSKFVLTPVAGNVLNCTLTVYPDRFQFSYNINGAGKTASDNFYYYWGPVGSIYAGTNASRFAFYNVGGGNVHSVGPVTVTSNHNKNADYLIVGSSIAAGSGTTYYYNRAISLIQKRTYSTFELNARPSNSIADFNINEIASYNATNLILYSFASNSITANGVSSALTDLATFLTAVGGISNAAAPSGYSIANGNLKICTELPRASLAVIATYNTSLFSTYAFSSIINTNAIVSDGTNTMPTFVSTSATNNFVYTHDGIHPNDLANSYMADEIIRALNLNKKDTYENSNFLVQQAPTPVSPNTFLDQHAGITISKVNVTDKLLNFGSLIGSNTGLNWPTATTNVSIGYNSTNGFVVYTNSGLTIGTQFTKTLRMNVDYFGGTTYTQGAQSSAWANAMTITGGAHTAMTASTPFNGSFLKVSAQTQTWAAGTLASQAFNYLDVPTIAFASASTATNVYNLFVKAPATNGANATVTNPYAFGTDGNIALTTAGNYIAIKEGSGGFMGQTTLVSGTKAISISGLTTSDRAIVTLVTPSGVTLTTTYQAVCTSGTLTIQANVAAGTINTSDGSTLNYIIFRPTP